MSFWILVTYSIDNVQIRPFWILVTYSTDYVQICPFWILVTYSIDNAQMCPFECLWHTREIMIFVQICPVEVLWHIDRLCANMFFWILVTYSIDCTNMSFWILVTDSIDNVEICSFEFVWHNRQTMCKTHRLCSWRHRLRSPVTKGSDYGCGIMIFEHRFLKYFLFVVETKKTNKSIEKSCCRSLFDSSPIDRACDVASIGLPSYK